MLQILFKTIEIVQKKISNKHICYFPSILQYLKGDLKNHFIYRLRGIMNLGIGEKYRSLVNELPISRPAAVLSVPNLYRHISAARYPLFFQFHAIFRKVCPCPLGLTCLRTSWIHQWLRWCCTLYIYKLKFHHRSCSVAELNVAVASFL